MRDAYVLDSGVALRWWVPQVGHEHAREVQAAALLLTSDRRLALAVGDLLDVEVLRGIGADPSR